MHAVSIKAGGIVPLPRVGGALSHAVGSIRNLPRHCQTCSKQDRALSECICRLHRSASQTLASRKFNVFIDLLIRQVYRWSFGNNQREFDPLWPRPLCLQDHTSHTEKNQFTNRRTSSRRLFL
jgi:hypothetical protein